MLIVFVSSCGSDDDNAPDEILEPNPVEGNEPPETFNLIAVSDNEKDVDTRPTFSWEESKDPDGDPVTYDIYIDVKNPPEALYSENISAVTFEATKSLGLLKDYYWRVEAKDDKGGRAESATYSFSTRDIRMPNEPITLNVKSGERAEASSVMFNDKLWVIGGTSLSAKLNDVWYSEDGENWIEATPNAQFPARHSHASVVFDGKIWVIAGSGNGGSLNDVWYSEDGINWIEATPNAQFSPMQDHTSVVFDNEIYVINGNAGVDGDDKSEVWSSEDGINWKIKSFLPQRNNHTSVVFDDKIWIIGGLGDGEFKNDVWQSEDGYNWNQVATGSLLFDKRVGLTSVVFDDKMWVIGGRGSGILFNDVWYSADGFEWKPIISFAPSFPGRSDHMSTVFKEKIWVIGGRDSFQALGDVWTID